MRSDIAISHSLADNFWTSQPRVKAKSGWMHPDVLKRYPNGKEFCFNYHRTGTCQAGDGCSRSHECQIKGCQGKHRTTACNQLRAKGITLPA